MLSQPGCCGSGTNSTRGSCGDADYCHGYALSHWLPRQCFECCEGLAGCRDASQLLEALAHAQDIVLADLVLAVLNILFVIVVDGAAFEKLQQLQSRYWVQGHLLLAIFSFADGVVSAYVMDYLGKMRVVRLLDTLYEVECFDRINDKVIFDASGVLTSYVEVIVIVQISVAFITAAFHFVKAFRREDMEGISSLSLMEAALELSELIASVAGYTQFMSAATSFYQMHTLMDGSRYRAAGPCMYSCCTSVSGFTPPGGAGAWSGSQPDAIVASACLGSMAIMVSLCLSTRLFLPGGRGGDVQERAGSAVQNPASAGGRVKSDSRVELEQKSNELEQEVERLRAVEQEVERLRAVVKLNPNVQVI